MKRLIGKNISRFQIKIDILYQIKYCLKNI